MSHSAVRVTAQRSSEQVSSRHWMRETTPQSHWAQADYSRSPHISLVHQVLPNSLGAIVHSFDQSFVGGSWFTASLTLSDWPSPSTLVYGDGAELSGWMLDLDLVAPSSLNLGDVNNQEYWGSILASVEAKANASVSVLSSS